MLRTRPRTSADYLGEINDYTTKSGFENIIASKQTLFVKNIFSSIDNISACNWYQQAQVPVNVFNYLAK